LRFLVDTQLPRALVNWIQSKGHEAIHVFDVGLAQGKDNPISQFAIKDNAVIVSKDDGFAKWIQQGRAGPQVAWLRIGNASNPTLIFWISVRWDEIIR